MNQEELNQLETAILERFKVVVRKALTVDELVSLDNVELTSKYDDILQALVLELRAYLASERLSGIKYPKDWWQAFKERWFPKWLLKRYPVQYHEAHVRAFYPKISFFSSLL